MSKLLTLIALFTMPFAAHAETYFYSATAIHCKVEARKQTITDPITQIGTLNSRFALQLFKSQPGEYPLRFTAFSALNDVADIQDFIANGGIPNSLAQSNWTVMQNQVSVKSPLAIPGVVPGQVEFIPVANNVADRVTVKLTYPWSLQVAQNILTALGDSNTPNFTNDRPATDFVGNTLQLTAYSNGLAWGSDVRTLIYGGFSGVYAYQEVQIHYPADRYNGLAYHIRFQCQPQVMP